MPEVLSGLAGEGGGGAEAAEALDMPLVPSPEGLLKASSEELTSGLAEAFPRGAFAAYLNTTSNDDMAVC